MKPREFARGEPWQRKWKKITPPTEYGWWTRMCNYMPWLWEYQSRIVWTLFAIFGALVIYGTVTVFG